MAITDRPQPPQPGMVWSDALGWIWPTVTTTFRAFDQGWPRDTTWPQPFATWVGGEYPVWVQPAQHTGWQCPGCSRCFSPDVAQCGWCGPGQTVTTTTTNCPPPLEGGMCGCPEPESP